MDTPASDTDATFAAALHTATLLFWALAAAVQWLGLQVTLASVREAHRSLVHASGAAVAGNTPGSRPRANASARWLLAQAALAMGTTLSASMVLGFAGQGPAYAVGYVGPAVAWLWTMAVLLALPPLALLAWTRSDSALAAAALWLAVAAAALDGGWLLSAGLQPGLGWHLPTACLAVGIMAGGLGLAFWIAYRGRGRSGAERRGWRAAASGIAAVALLLGERLMMAATELELQVRSATADALPAQALNMVAASCAPLLLLLMLLLLLARRQRRPRRRTGGGAGLSTVSEASLDTLPAPERRRGASGRRRRIRRLA